MSSMINYRCFPACSVRGHTKGGFCGRPLQVLFDIRNGQRTNGSKSPEEFVSKLVFIAEIRPEGVPGLSSNLIVEKSRVQAMIRSNVRVNGAAGELVLGKVVASNNDGGRISFQVDFNGEHHSWDYSWKSNRWEVNKTHVIDVMILEECRNNSFHVLRNFPSPSFTIFSARHMKTNSERNPFTAATSPNSVDKRPEGLSKSKTSVQQGYGSKALQTAETSAQMAIGVPYGGALSMQMGLVSSAHHQLSQKGFLSMVGGDSNLNGLMPTYPRSNYTHSSSSDDNGSLEGDSSAHYNYSSTTIISSSDEDGGGLDNTSPVAAKRRRIGSDETGRPGESRLLELCGVVEAITRGHSFDEDD